MTSGSDGLTDADRTHLRRALALARRGWGGVHPNPMVGCVIVREEVVVGEGWHREWGGPHAEVAALAEAGAAARGATAFVSLEPCRHEGKTGACTVALQEAGIRRVVFGAADPGRESGGGAKELRSAGVEVVGPVLTPAEARRENPAFFHSDEARPWTALKLAVSLDGGIAAAPGRRTPVSGPEVGRRVQELRAGFDAILVGARTARVDDPLLTVRGPVEPRVPPRRVVLDGRGTLEPGARLLSEGDGVVQLVTTEAAEPDWLRRMEDAGARVLTVEGRDGRVEPAAALRALRSEGVEALLCEGGGVVASALLSRGLVDRLYLAVAPRFLGPDAVAAFPQVEGGGRWEMAGDPERLGRDVWLTLDREV